MASKKKSNKLKMRGYRTHRLLRYRVKHTDPGESNQDNHYIDIGRDLSALNRRMYKQGMIYNISNISFHDSQSNLQFEMCTLPDIWATYSAYRQARRIWKRQHYGSGLPVGAWTQFVVGMNKDQFTDQDTLLPLTQEEWTAARGEWLASCLSYNFTSPTDTEATAALWMLGAKNSGNITQSGDINSGLDSNGTGNESHGCAFVRNDGSGTTPSLVKQAFTGGLGIMQEYGAIKSDVAETPDATESVAHADSVFARLDQAASGYTGSTGQPTTIINRVSGYYDHPPYPQDIVALDATGSNADTYVQREVRFASGQKTIMTPGFDVPLGLIQVVTTASGNQTGYIDIEISPGRYKGVAALEI